MEPIHVILIIVGSISFLVLAALITAFICFRIVFYSGKRRATPIGEYDLPEGKPYEEFQGDMIRWQDSIREMKSEAVEIISRDGLTLRGRYYEHEKGAPIEILFHGYRGGAVRDLCGGVERCFKLKRNALIVSQRAHGDSEGHAITFGYKERFDCLDWIDHVISRFGKDQKIIITGLSMGASTVLMASGEALPDNVVSVIADCGYSSTKSIIKKKMHEMHLPVWFFYPFVRLGGILFAGFDPNKCEPIEAVKRSKTPILFVHGDADDFVPCDMSRQMFEVCPVQKAFFIAKGAGHGLAFPKDQEGYYKAVLDFESVLNG